MMPDWTALLETYKADFLEDLANLIAIASVKDPSSATKQAPYGKAIRQALDYMMVLGERDGFTGKLIDHVAGHLEIGQGEDIFGILAHLDVVPVQEEKWQTPPFTLTQKDGWLFGRGVSDDKGPLLAAYYAVKMIQDLGLTWNQKIRLIYGTDEENDWGGVKAYFAKEKMPDFGFVPDGIFPMIYAEKGIISLDLVQEDLPDSKLSFQSGKAYNVVPDQACAKLEHSQSVKEPFAAYLKQHKLSGHWQAKGNQQILTLVGKAAHATGPDRGINAAVYLAHFLVNLPLDTVAKSYLTFIDQFFYQDTKAKRLGMAYKHSELGDTTINAALFSFDKGKASIGLNLRYPQGYDIDNQLNKLTSLSLSSSRKTTPLTQLYRYQG